MKRFIAFSAYLAVALMFYDAILHTATLIVPRQWDEDGALIQVLPWLLFPLFPTWFTYDLVWAALHFFAAIAMTGYVLSKR